MHSIKVSAPGKVILFGEHSVVYGKLAIAASLDLRTYVTLKEHKSNKLQIQFENLELEKKYHVTVLNTILNNSDFKNIKEKAKLNWKEPEKIDLDEFISIITKSINVHSETLVSHDYKSLIAFFCIYFGLLLSTNTNAHPISVNIKTDLSLGSGTGSSASLMVSLTAALVRYISLKNSDVNLAGQKDELTKNHVKASDNFNEAELNIISKWAYFGERIIHGNPSGIDNTICTYGALVSFRKTRAPIPIKSKTNIMGLLVDTKVPKNTQTLVKNVADLRKKHTRVIDNILSAMDNIADEAIEILIQLSEIPESDEAQIEICFDTLANLTSLNHHLLRALNVSHPAIENIIQVMRCRNVIGKLTGAGGGGYAIALIPSSIGTTTISDLCRELTAEGYKPLVIKLGGPGVRIEH